MNRNSTQMDIMQLQKTRQMLTDRDRERHSDSYSDGYRYIDRPQKAGGEKVRWRDKEKHTRERGTERQKAKVTKAKDGDKKQVESGKYAMERQTERDKESKSDEKRRSSRHPPDGATFVIVRPENRRSPGELDYLCVVSARRFRNSHIGP